MNKSVKLDSTPFQVTKIYESILKSQNVYEPVCIRPELQKLTECYRSITNYHKQWDTTTTTATSATTSTTTSPTTATI